MERSRSQIRSAEKPGHWWSSLVSLIRLFTLISKTSGNWIASHGRSVMRLNRHALFLCSNYAQHDQAPYLFSDLITIDVFIWITINICWFASVYTLVFIRALTDCTSEITANEQPRRFLSQLKSPLLPTCFFITCLQSAFHQGSGVTKCLTGAMTSSNKTLCPAVTGKSSPVTWGDETESLPITEQPVIF